MRAALQYRAVHSSVFNSVLTAFVVCVSYTVELLASLASRRLLQNTRQRACSPKACSTGPPHHPGANGVWRLVTQVQPPQRAAVHLALAKAVHAVFLCYLRAAGAAEDSHASKAAVRSPMLRGHT